MRVPDLSPDFNEHNFRRVVNTLNTVLRGLSLGNNFNGQIIEDITIAAGSEAKIAHNLKTVPKYRIILRQDQVDALVTDGPSLWNDRSISLYNHGASDTVITIMLLRR